ncbi:S1C family serine protease [Cobetia marina]|uniref:S1C family serine protease n=1 Tax=Cobetia marina TaxID=28258 RepID=UPI003A8DF714
MPQTRRPLRSSLLPLLWPVVTGVLLAIVVLDRFPELGHSEPAPEVGQQGGQQGGAIVSRDQQVLPSPALTLSAEQREESANPVLREAPPLQRNSGPASYQTAVDAAAPAVVNIYSSRKIEDDSKHPLMSDPFFNQFYGENALRSQRMLSSLGSGVILSRDGYILTNNHVIQGADQIQVALRDGRETLAKVVGVDPESDLAALKIDLEDLPTVAIADSTQVHVGDVSLAIGNPFGVGQTVTMGIISATGRNHLGLNAYEDFIQTDAAINPGNSGGALINTDGSLVGINTAIYSRSGGSQGIGFAIPANLARDILESLVDHGRVIRGWLGLEVQELTPSLAHSFGLSAPQGVVVAAVLRDGPAAQAGLRPGDILTAVAGKRLIDARLAMADIAAVKPGDTLQLNLLRDGKPMEVSVKVGERPIPDSTPSPAAAAPGVSSPG